MQHNDLFTKAMIIGLVILSTAIHEMGHAFVATWLGDPTPGRNGRLTLNPIPHLQPVITAIIMPIIMFLSNFGLFILAATPIDPSKFRHPLRDQALVAVAGPIMNVVCAAVLLGILWIPGVWNPEDTTVTMYAVWYASAMNLILAAFNMIPLPPLDGYRILRTALPLQLRIQTDNFARSPYCFMVALVVGSSIIPHVADPIFNFVAKLLPH